MLAEAVFSANALDDHVARMASSDLVVDLHSSDVLFVKKKVCGEDGRTVHDLLVCAGVYTRYSSRSLCLVKVDRFPAEGTVSCESVMLMGAFASSTND